MRSKPIRTTFCLTLRSTPDPNLSGSHRAALEINHPSPPAAPPSLGRSTYALGTLHLKVVIVRKFEPIGKRLIDDAKEWPNRWASLPCEIEFGRRINLVLVSFLESLVSQGASDTAIRKHYGNLFCLGEAIIDDNESIEFSKFSSEEIVNLYIDNEGGPISRHFRSETEQKYFDSTCKKLYKYLLTQKVLLDMQ